MLGLYLIFFNKITIIRYSYLARIQINLVANDDERKVIWVAWTRLDEELISPAVQRPERVCRCHIIDQDAAVGTTVERYAERLETLLASCVPDLHRRKYCPHIQTEKQETFGQVFSHDDYRLDKQFT